MTTPRRVTAALFGFIVVVVILALVTPGDALRGLRSGQLPLLLTYLGVLIIAEQFRLALPGRLPTSPMAAAAGLALAVTTRRPNGPVMLSSAEIVATVALAQVIGNAVLTRRRLLAADRSDVILDAAVRLFSIAVCAVLVRETPLFHGQPFELASQDWPGWLSAMALFATGLGLALIEAPLRSARRSASEHTNWRQAATDEARGGLILVVAVTSTGVLVAFTISVLGVAAVPLALLFLALTEFAVHRYVHVRETYGQSLRALASMPEVVGYVAEGHSRRVSEVCLLVARELGMSERDIDSLGMAATLHDIGQLALRRPLPDGATVQAAPSDQQRIADSGAQLVRTASPPVPLGDLLSSQAVPYHRVMSGRADVPLGARVLKVANAFDDYGGRLAESESPARRAAMERLYLGLGYEYDPRVVAALERVVSRSHAGQ